MRERTWWFSPEPNTPPRDPLSNLGRLVALDVDEVALDSYRICQLCRGRGWYEGVGGAHTCFHCGGTGWVVVSQPVEWWEREEFDVVTSLDREYGEILIAQRGPERRELKRRLAIAFFAGMLLAVPLLLLLDVLGGLAWLR